MKQSRKDYRKSELEKSIQFVSDNQEAVEDRDKTIKEMKDITIETRLAIEMATSYSKGGDVIRSDEVPRIFELLTDRIKELEDELLGKTTPDRDIMRWKRTGN